MWVVWAVGSAAAAILLVVLSTLRSDFRGAARGWQLLAVSGLLLALGGLGFAIRFWEPTPGPYVANELYPFGPYLNAWAVSFGFTWLGFGLLFLGVAVHGASHASGRLWIVLLASWLLCWLPHGVIAIGFAWAGHNEPSLRLYREWGSGWIGLLRMSSSAVILVGHFACSIGGFVLSGLQLWRNRGVAGQAPGIPA